MNPEAQQVLDGILKLNPQDLTSYDRKFLFARRVYLNDEQKRIFASVLEQEEAAAAQKLADEQPKPVQIDEVNKDGVYVAKKDRK